MKYFAPILFLLVLTSCGSNDEPAFLKLQLGSSEKDWKGKLISFKQNGEITSDDSTNFVCKIINKENEDTLFLDFYPNNDGYFEGNLRSLKVWLMRSDTLGMIPIKLSEVYQLYRSIEDKYGKPDSLRIFTLKSLKNPPPDYSIEKDSIIKNGLHAYWNNDKVHIRFYAPASDDDIGKCQRFSEIIISSQNAEQEKSVIKERIRKSLLPKDLLTWTVETPYWTESSEYIRDRKMNYIISNVRRIGREEPRTITAAKFDFICLNAFKEELFRIQDVEITFAQPLWISDEGTTFTNTDLKYTASTQYASFNSKFNGFERARDNPDNFKYKAIPTIVVFDDGTVLKDSAEIAKRPVEIN